MTEIDKVNVIVFKDATPSGADVEGKMWVGGNAVFEGYGVASKETAIINCSDWGLVVGGSLVMNGGSVNGKIAYGTTATYNNSGATCGVWKAKPVDFPTVEAKLKAYSQAFRYYDKNIGVVTASNGSLVLTGTSTSLNVFNVTAAQLNANIKIVAPEGSSIIVNVSGTVINWVGVGFSMPDGSVCRGGTSDWCHRILWNMYEAKTIYLNGIGVQGSVLAPFATVDGSGGNIDGQLVCEYLKGSIEYHPYFFTGCLILPDP
jgi:choice-of-anchor A domain-containing protein